MSAAGGSQDVVRSAVPIADLSAVDAALAQGPEALKRALQRVLPADLGRDLSRRAPDEARAIFEALDDRRRAAMLRAAHPAVAGRLLAQCTAEHGAHTLAFLAVDHQAAILVHLPMEARSRIEAALPPAEREAVAITLAYPDASVGRLMTPKVWRAELAESAGDAMRNLREHCTDIEVAVNLYVVSQGKLVGVAALREVATAPPETALSALMVERPIRVEASLGRGDAADIIRTHNFLSLPVVQADGMLVGAVRVDDLLDAALDKVGTGFLNQGGVSGTAIQAPYFQTSTLQTVRSRLTWLVLLFVAEMATGTVMRYFDGELQKLVALSFFVPLLLGTGGNAGSQTVSTVIRALALGEVRTRDVWRVVSKEIVTGLLVGLLIGTVAFGRALLWGVHDDLALCVGVTVLAVCTWASAVGAAIPIAAESLGIDPTLVSAPAISTLVDASGLIIYFTTAHLLVAQLQ